MQVPKIALKIKLVRYAIFVALVFFMLVFVFKFPRVSLPLFFSYIATLFISPFVEILRRGHFKKKIFFAVIFFAITGVIAYLGVEFFSRAYGQIASVEYDWPKFEAYSREKLEKIHLGIEQTFGFKFQNNWINDFFIWLKKDLNLFVVNIPSYLSNFLEWLFLVPFFTFYLIKDGKKLKNLFLQIVPNGIFESMYYLVFQFHQKFKGYFVAKLLEAIAVGFIVYIGLESIRYPFSFVLGVFAGVTNIVPYIGPAVGFLPGLVVGMVLAVPKSHVWVMGAVYVGANILDVIFIFPALVSRVVNVHPAVVIVGVFMGSQLGGALGMLLSVPIISIVKLIIEEMFSRIVNAPQGSATFDEDL